MRRILKLLTRLYPSAWRSRYAAEYEALLEDATPHPQDAVNILWEATKMQLTSRSFVRIVLPCTIAGALIAAAISFAIQPRYTSQAIITVADSASITGGHLDQTLATLRDSTLSREFLASVIQEYNLYPSERASMPLDKVVDKMRQNIEMIPLHSPAKASPSDEHTSSFAVDFVYPDPKIAQQVDQSLISQLIWANLVARANRAAVPDRSDWTNFRIPDPASLPTSPIYPRRSLFALGGLLAGFLCGLMLAALATRTNTVTVQRLNL